MAVYVDDFFVPYRNMMMCHMIADTHQELINMVDKIGVKRKWIQNAGTVKEHFDICQTKRKLAIKKGVIPVTARELLEIRNQKNKIMSEMNHLQKIVNEKADAKLKLKIRDAFRGLKDLPQSEIKIDSLLLIDFEKINNTNRFLEALEESIFNENKEWYRSAHSAKLIKIIENQPDLTNDLD